MSRDGWIGAGLALLLFILQWPFNRLTSRFDKKSADARAAKDSDFKQRVKRASENPNDYNSLLFSAQATILQDVGRFVLALTTGLATSGLGVAVVANQWPTWLAYVCFAVAGFSVMVMGQAARNIYTRASDLRLFVFEVRGAQFDIETKDATDVIRKGSNQIRIRKPD